MKVLDLRRKIRSLAPTIALLPYWLLRDRKCVNSFLRDRTLELSQQARWRLLRRLYTVSHHVECPHDQSDMLSFSRAILSISQETKGCVVEAGSFKGGGTTKISIAAKAARRDMVVFDSFEGIPENRENHGKNIFGGGVAPFKRGDFRGSIEEVQANVARYGEIGICRFVKGFFDSTLPHFKEPVAAAYLDVDLASSTCTCLKYLWPLLVPGGYLFSQDGHLPLVLEIFGDDRFWTDELGSSKPAIHGFGTEQLIWMQKPLLASST